MKPLINLKAFLAVWLILIVTASLLVAYFRDYSATAQGHDHSKMENGGDVAMSNNGDTNAMKPGSHSHAAMGHDDTAKLQDGPMQSRPEQAHAGPASPSKQPGPALPYSVLPGNAGASHLYHIGATGFLLDHPQHVTLSAEQRKSLNQIKERATLEKSSADRKVQEAEQQLWKITAADQPDVAKIETKVREVEKLRGDERLGFIRAVGEAAKVLTEEQRITLVGTTQPGTSAAISGAPEHQHKP